MKVSKMNITTVEMKKVFELWHNKNQSEPEEYCEMEDYTSEEYGEATTETFLEILKEVRNESK